MIILAINRYILSGQVAVNTDVTYLILSQILEKKWKASFNVVFSLSWICILIFNENIIPNCYLMPRAKSMKMLQFYALYPPPLSSPPSPKTKIPQMDQLPPHPKKNCILLVFSIHRHRQQVPVNFLSCI